MLSRGLIGMVAVASLAAWAASAPPSAAQVRAMPANVVPSAGVSAPGCSAEPWLADCLAPGSPLGPDVAGLSSGFGGVEGRTAGGYHWQLLPDGLMYPAYLAGQRESRIACQWVHEEDENWLWDATLGGHVGLLRFGTDDPLLPEGWQIDVEGAAFPRLDWATERELVATDYRFGVPLTARHGLWEYKLAYYHLSSHLGDEFMVRHATFARVNYVRDTLVLGAAMRPFPDLRLYTEAGWAFYTNGGAEPWEFQFGLDFSPAEPTGLRGSPFLALNGHLREEVDFGGSLSVQAGWQWRGETGHLLRTGLMYFNGHSVQYQFFRRHEEHIGFGAWYDF